MVLNILSNAIKFTFKEGSINIYSSLERHTITTHNPILEKPNQDKEVCLIKVSIKDNGPGISKKDQKKLFKLFGKLKSTDQMNTNGIGLGLCISKSICEVFDGTISVKSKLNMGSIFTIYF